MVRKRTSKGDFLTVRKSKPAKTAIRKLRDFVQWIEGTVHLPIGLAAEPGRIKLPKVYARQMGDNFHLPGSAIA
jgi:hypothetical protein